MEYNTMTALKVYWENDPDDELKLLDAKGLQQLYPGQKEIGLRIIGASQTGADDAFLTLHPKNPNMEKTIADHTVEQWTHILKDMPEADKAKLILFIIGDHTEKETSREFKMFALDIAETLGPDHCQTMYRLAVLATKLA
jgi:hypothetical protein